MAFFREMQYSRIQRTLLPRTFSSWLCLQIFIHLVFIQSGMLVVVMGLRLESISVPQSGIKGSSVMLGCEFRLDDETDKLYSLKWFKDEHEFFRYTPHGRSPVTTFTLPGVQVDDTEYRPFTSNRVVFKLKNLRISSGGVYKCEISADAPTFKTLQQESNLSVIVLPDPPVPRLRMLPQSVQLGERVRGNCSFARSYPPAVLTFYVNGAKVNNTEDMKVKNYEPRVDGVIDDHNWSGGSSSTSGGSSSNNGVSRQYQYHQQQQQQSSASSSYGRRPESNVQGVEDRGRVVEPRNTYTSIAGIEFRLTDRQQFHRLGQILTIRCEAVVVDQKWATQTNITQQPSQLSIAGQNRYSSSGSAEYLIPIFSFANVSKTVKLSVFIFTWILFVC